jgi:choline monooxygenase
MDTRRFEVDADVRRAHTLDKAFYLDDAAFAAATERIFARGWHWLGMLDDVAGAGRLAPRTLLPGLLDEPLLLARDAGGTLRALSNVCTHRGNVLVEAPCAAADITCRYHGRRFALDGRLRGMPGFEGVAGFPSPRDDLAALPLGHWAGHGFAALAPALPLDDVLAEMQACLAWLPIETWRPDASRSRDYEFDAHWALYVENYLEGLHIPFVHPGLAATIDMAGYRYELGRASVLQLAQALPGEAAFDVPEGVPRHGQRIAAYYWWLFPNLMFNVYPWGLSVNVVVPLSKSRTRVLFRSFVADAAALGQGAGGALDAVEMEDESVVLGVQRGLRSRFYGHGRYAPHHEAGVHHFHRLIGEFMHRQEGAGALR